MSEAESSDISRNAEEIELENYYEMDSSEFERASYLKRKRRSQIEEDVNNVSVLPLLKGYKKAVLDVDETRVSRAPDERYFTIECFCLRWFFCWVTPYLIRGFFSSPSIQDLPRVAGHCTCNEVEKKFDRIWPKMRRKLLVLPLESESSEMVKQINSLRDILPKDHEIYPSEDVEYVRKNNWEIWVYLLLLQFVYFINVWGLNYSMHTATRVGLKIRTLLVSKVYQKSLKISNKSRGVYKNGVILNFVGNDLNKIEIAHEFMFLGLTSWIMLVGILYFLIEILGVAAVAGTCTNFVVIPFGVVILGIFLIAGCMKVKYQDRRMTNTNEFLQSVRIVKYFAWEDYVLKKIRRIRTCEVFLLRVVFTILSFLYSIIISMSQISSLVAFVTFFLVNGYLDSISVFTSMTYFVMMRVPLFYAPMGAVLIVNMLIGFSRVEKFLKEEEFEPIDTTSGNKEYPIIIEEGNFEWDEVLNEQKKGNIIMNFVSSRIKKKKKEEEKNQEGSGKKDKDFKMGGLKDINLRIKKNDLVMVIGSVASGKTSLLQAILGNMRKVSGEVKIYGKCAFASQNPWIQKETLKENVLFGDEDDDEDKWEEIVDCCQLQKDLEEIGGEYVQIGEKGMTLSGGQQYRVQLARACYNRKYKLVLLDDPFASVDAHVGKRIFRSCVSSESGYLRNRTRIVVTHQLDYLEYSDWVVLMDDGRILEQGKYHELMENKNGALFKFVSKNVSKSMNEEEEGGGGGEEEGGEEIEEEEEDVFEIFDDEVIVEEEVSRKKRRERRMLANLQRQKENLIEEEEIKMGATSPKTVCSYVCMMCPCCYGCFGFIFSVTFILMGCILAICVQILTDWWISSWTNGRFNEQFSTSYHLGLYISGSESDGSPIFSYFDINDPEYAYIEPPYYNSSSETNDGYVNCSRYGMGMIEASKFYTCPSIIGACGCEDYLIDVTWKKGYDNGTRIEPGLSQIQSCYIYAICGVMCLLVMFIRNTILSNFAISAAQELHNRALKRVLHSKMEFFDRNPLGRITSRFSGDLSKVDGKIIIDMIVLIGFLFGATGFFVIIIINTNGFGAIFIVFLVTAYLLIFLLFRRNNVDLNRLEGVTKTPILSQISESLNGVQTIRAYNSEKRFIESLREKINVHNRAYWLMRSTQRWLGFHVGLMGFFFVLSICILLIMIFYYWDSVNLEIEYTALALGYSIFASQIVFMIFEKLCDVDGMFNSIERLDFYAKEIPIEEIRTEKKNNPLELKDGSVKFQNYSMRYRSGLDLVLQNVSFTIHPNERIGILGRTGAGKSSLLISLLRIVEGTQGKILLGGQDISDMDLKQLRSTISVIPQSSSLFSGTIRSNIDPFHRHQDEELWNVLEQSHMKDKVLARKKKLKAVVEEGGSNFSVGERQLLCIARALLRNPKVLIMDEATSSVDVDTDEKIQKIISESFDMCTSLIIAHRLETVTNSDRILVMEQGQVGEFDTPENLVEGEKYHLFKDLIKETGKERGKVIMEQILGNKEKKEEGNGEATTSTTSTSEEEGESS